MNRVRRSLERARGWWSARTPTLRWSIGGGAVGALAGLAIVLGVLASGGGKDNEATAPVVVSTAPSTSTPTPAATATPNASSDPGVSAAGSLDDPWFITDVAAPDPTPDPTPNPIPTVGNLDDLHESYGEAPDATLGRFRIPVLGIDAPLGQRFVNGTAMPNPTGPGDIVWYDLSQWEGLGGVPGGGGNAIFSGHVDYAAPVAWAEANYRGGGVFLNLALLSPGDLIEVQVGGNVLRYSVVWRQQVSSGPGGNWASIFSSDVEVDSITLITCGGDFDFSERSYNERVVVRAQRI